MHFTFSERAAFKEFDAKQPRELAEQSAAAEVLKSKQR
jgi:hypothetical protein